jgi:hypothetical protein
MAWLARFWRAFILAWLAADQNNFVSARVEI